MKSNSVNQAVTPDQENAFALPLDREILFSNYKGDYKKGIEKRQTKLLKKTPFLKSFLKEDERILLITTGCSPTSFLEQLLTGWIFIYLKRSLLIFTNSRIFHIPTKRNYSYRNSIAQVLYSDCKSIQIKGRNLIVEYKNGMKEKFLYIARKEKRKIKALLPTISFEGPLSKTQKRTHLCPRCTADLDEGKYICENCYLEFKNKDDAKNKEQGTKGSALDIGQMIFVSLLKNRGLAAAGPPWVFFIPIETDSRTRRLSNACQSK